MLSVSFEVSRLSAIACDSLIFIFLNGHKMGDRFIFLIWHQTEPPLKLFKIWLYTCSFTLLDFLLVFELNLILLCNVFFFFFLVCSCDFFKLFYFLVVVQFIFLLHFFAHQFSFFILPKKKRWKEKGLFSFFSLCVTM